jgi:hypothetical protein
MPDGFTAVMKACVNGHKQCVQALIEAKANLKAALPGGKTALMLAAQSGHEQCALLILQASADCAVSDARPSLEDFLYERVKPVDGCAKCATARDPNDPTVRSKFTSECGNGRVRDLSKKRACCLLSHSINASRDLTPIAEQYEKAHGVHIANKRQKCIAFMKDRYGVEPLGPGPQFAVTLYKEEPSETGGVKLVDAGRVNTSFMGFRICDKDATQ